MTTDHPQESSAAPLSDLAEEVQAALEVLGCLCSPNHLRPVDEPAPFRCTRCKGLDALKALRFRLVGAGDRVEAAETNAEPRPPEQWPEEVRRRTLARWRAMEAFGDLPDDKQAAAHARANTMREIEVECFRDAMAQARREERAFNIDTAKAQAFEFHMSMMTQKPGSAAAKRLAHMSEGAEAAGVSIKRNQAPATDISNNDTLPCAELEG